MLSPHSVLFLFIQMHHDEMGVRSDSLLFQFIYAKRRPSFLLKLILVIIYLKNTKTYSQEVHCHSTFICKLNPDKGQGFILHLSHEIGLQK